MDKRTKSVSIFLIGSIVLVIIIFVGRDLYLRSTQTIQCDDGPRKKIDSREFSTKNWAYAIELEASIENKAKFTGKLDPRQLQSLSEAAQQAGEFRKYLVAGYNSCAISKVQYEKLGKSFQAIDGLSRQINTLASQAALSTVEKSALSRLVMEYIDLTSRLAAEENQ